MFNCFCPDIQTVSIQTSNLSCAKPWYAASLVFLMVCLFCVNSAAQECTLPSRIYLPQNDPQRYQQFGHSLDVDGEYMVVGAPNNCVQQTHSGMVTLYKLNAAQKWERLAELTPSDPDKGRRFGYDVDILGNTIVVSGVRHGHDGGSSKLLYIYEKPASGEWTSTSENYTIAKALGSLLESSGFGYFQLHEDKLLAVASVNSVMRLEVYRPSDGKFSLIQTIILPTTAGSSHTWNIAAGPRFVALSSDRFKHADGSYGAVFVYPEAAPVYDTTPALLKAEGQTKDVWKAFGVGMTVHESTLIVQGTRTDGDGKHFQTFYFIEEPVAEWTNMNVSHSLERPGYVTYDVRLLANQNYLFSRGSGSTVIVAFKKNGPTWSSNAIPFVIDRLTTDKFYFGYAMGLNENHLVVGCPGVPVSTGIADEFVAGYYSPSGSWESWNVNDSQLIRRADPSAAWDEFGDNLSVYGRHLVVSARGDDELGNNTGLVYVFDLEKAPDTPQQKIFSPDGEEASGFGAAMAVGDSVLFIGAPSKDSIGHDGRKVFYGHGKVYVYRLREGEWQYASNIVAPIVTTSQYFGRNVAWSKGYCAVMEYDESYSGSFGHVHLYKEDPLTKKFIFLATLDPSNSFGGDWFGQSMVFTDSMIVIGTGGGAPNINARRSVHIFKKSGEWRRRPEDAILRASDTSRGDRFGASVSMYGKYIVVGAPASGPTSGDPQWHGAAYLFKQPPGGWKGDLTEIAKILPSDRGSFGGFGVSVAIDHDDIFVGSSNSLYGLSSSIYTDKDGQLHPGKIYHYKKPNTGWVSTDRELRQIQSFEPEYIDGFGRSLFVSDRYLYVGAAMDDTMAGYRSGSVQTMLQLPAIDELPILCVDQVPRPLKGFPKGGSFSGPGVNQTTSTFSPAAAGPGIHEITYVKDGCVSSIFVEVKAERLIILSQSPASQTSCHNESITVKLETNRISSDYRWYFRKTKDDPYVKLDSMKQSIEVANSGLYLVVINLGLCEPHQAEFAVQSEDPVVIHVDTLPIICATDPVSLSASPEGGTWQGSGITPFGTFDPTNYPVGKFWHVYTYIAPGQTCVWKDSVATEVDVLYQPSLRKDKETVCRDKPATLTIENADGRSAVRWYKSDGEIAGNTGSSLVTYAPGTYSATVRKHECSLSTEAILIVPEPDTLFVPNVFTANGDLVNDYFEIRSEGISDFHLSVFNRYGVNVYETDNIDFKWGGENVSTGVFFWRVTYRSCAKFDKEQKGWVHVIK